MWQNQPQNMQGERRWLSPTSGGKSARCSTTKSQICAGWTNPGTSGILRLLSNRLKVLQEDPLANIKSAIKRIRSSERKQQHNRVTRGRTRSAVKDARQALTEGKSDKAKAEINK